MKVKDYCIFLLSVLSLFPFPSSSQFVSVKIGVVFSREDFNTTTVKTVDEAVEMINRRGDVLPGMRLTYSPIFYDGNSFNLGRTLCKGISDGVRAVVSQVMSCSFSALVLFIISDWSFFYHGQPSCSEYLPWTGYSLLADQGRHFFIY